MTTAQDQQSRAELLPCPFCGEPAEMIRHAPIFHVRCRQWACGCHGSSTFEYSPEKAIISWNRRVPAAPVQMPEPVAKIHQGALTWNIPWPEYSVDPALLSGSHSLYTEAQVRALLASAQQDAARYRWVREQAEFFPLVMDGTGLLCAELAEAEAEIDAAIEAAPKEPAP